MNDDRAALARLRRVETRPAGRGMVIVHEIDESHPANNSCDICTMVTLRSEGPGPMTEPREALATSICSTFDMGHHHHEAFLQPDHCEDGLSDADELLRSLRAQGYSVARSEGPGLDALRLALTERRPS